ncbi:MAG: undecaprenyl-diphosphate phosphatase [Gemmatales bacterium]|nr:undecaprenyl-diphosphate phosphatase [Gemmatales bacterium]MDW7993175.1 undecaprenyl-diphosphate phosphatase [Gemmatales bacterium]
MEWWQALLLGLVQGITEFLPISSSGHLVLVQQFLPLVSNDPTAALFFDGLLHLGTTLAVGWYFLRVYWLQPTKSRNFGTNRSPSDRTSDTATYMASTPPPNPSARDGPLGQTDYALSWWSWCWLVAWASWPTVVAVVWLDNHIQASFVNVPLVAADFLVLGALLWFTDRLPRGTITLSRLHWYHACLIGFAQALAALFRGLSRSGLTITTALLLGVERLTAVRFSFALALVANSGLAVLGIWHAINADTTAAWLTIDFILKTSLGTGFSALVAYRTIKPLLNLVERAQLRWFSYYLWSSGLLAWGHYIARSG